METVTVNATKRTELGKKATSKVRKAGLVPGVIYGGDEVVHFTIEALALRSLIYTPDFKLAEIEVDGNKHTCVLKDMQFHPVTDNLMHVDFVELVKDKPVNVEIPVRFKGVSPGVKAGGKLIPLVRRVKVKTTPDKLVDALYIDISNLELGYAVRVRDIESVEGFEIMNNSSIPVATVETPRALRSATDAATKEATATATADAE